MTAQHLLPRSFLVAFVSEFDSFLGQLYLDLLQMKPALINASERKLSYKELQGFSSVDEARRYMLNQEVDGLLRSSYSGQFDTLEQKFGIKLRKGLERWPLFIEVTERRHLFVHSDGKVSSQYLQVCKEHGVDLKDIAIGAERDANSAYLVEAYKCLLEIGVKLGQVLWRKVKPEELSLADSALGGIAYDLLVDEKSDLATRLLEFSVDTLPKHGTEQARRMAVINLAQAYKFGGQAQKVAPLLAKDDWSACEISFHICLAVLNDNYGDAEKLMMRIGAHGTVDEFAYSEWPIFRKFRESKEFKRAFFNVFNKEPAGEEKQEGVTAKEEAAEQNSPESEISARQVAAKGKKVTRKRGTTH